jgi:fatty-acyl-CoA synthase
VLLNHANFFWTNLSLDLVAPITQEDVVLQVLPQFHIGGWNVQPMLAWWKGATVVLESAFDPARVLALVAERRVTTMAGVPTIYQMIGQHPDFATADLSTMRSAVVGGAAMPYTLVEQWHARGVALFQGYGLTESAPNVFCLDDADALSHPCSVGRPYPYVDVALFDRERHEVVDGPGQGELLVRGPSLFAGYWRDPAATAAVMDDGWLRTGDVAARDIEGYYRIVGRAKEMFVTGGENVYPVEVESVITSFNAVVSAAVVSVPDPTWGESGVAFVECARGETVDLDALMAHCRARLAHYKVPVRFEVVAELPRNSVGKTDKATLRTRAREEAARSA